MRGAQRLQALWLLPFAVLAASPAAAQDWAPQAPRAEMLTTFSGDNWSHLCAAGAVRPVALLGELARTYRLNFFALPPHPRLLDHAVPDSVEARAAAWLITAVDIRAPHAGISDDDFLVLNSIARGLGEYLQLATNAPRDHRFRVAIASREAGLRPALASPTVDSDSARTQLLLLALFGDVLDVRPDASVTISCLPPPSPAGNVTVAQNPAPSPRGGSRGQEPSIAVRGQIDDLVALRGTDEFKKASAATIAFTDNNEAGTTNFAINGVVGLGTNFGPNNALYAFVQYTRNDTETDVVGDDDDSKDVHSISPGLFFRRPVALGRSIYGTLGLTAYATFDLRNDAQLLRSRLVYSDITVALPVGHGFLCGQQRSLGFLYADCRLSAFFEAAEVLDAGRNVDLLTNIDDEYVGIGGQAGLILSPQGPAELRPLTFTASYRIMHILSGQLDDPRGSLEGDVRPQILGRDVAAVPEIAGGRGAEGAAERGGEGAGGGIAGRRGDLLDGSACGELLEGAEQGVLAAPAAGGETGLGQELAFESPDAEADGAGERSGICRLRCVFGDQGGRADEGRAGRLRQVEGRRSGLPEFVEDQGGERGFDGVAAVEHALTRGAQDQGAEQGGDADHGAILRKGPAPAGAEIERAQIARRGEADRMDPLRRHEDRPVRRHDPGALLGPDMEQASRGIDELVPAMAVPLDPVPCLDSISEAADQQERLVAPAPTFSRHQKPE